MRIAITPFAVIIVFVSFFVRGEVLRMTRLEYDYLLANVAFFVSFATLFFLLHIFLIAIKYDETKLLSISATKERIIDFLAICLILIAYVFLLVEFGGDFVSGRFSILLVPIPIVIVLYFLELRWLRDV